ENVSKLVELSVQRSKTTLGIKNENTFKQFDSEMESRKLVLLENISSAKAALEYGLDLVNSKIGGVESSIKKLPFEKQDQMEIARKYNLGQEFLGIFLRSEEHTSELQSRENLV